MAVETLIQLAVTAFEEATVGRWEALEFLNAMKSISCIWIWATTQIYYVILQRPVHMKQNIVITCWFSSLNRFRGKMLLSGAVWHSIGNYVVCWLDFTWWCPVMKCTSMFPYSIYPDIDFQYWWMTYQCDNCSAECRNLNFDQTKWFFMSLWLGATTSLWWGQV